MELLASFDYVRRTRVTRVAHPLIQTPGFRQMHRWGAFTSVCNPCACSTPHQTTQHKSADPCSVLYFSQVTPQRSLTSHMHCIVCINTNTVLTPILAAQTCSYAASQRVFLPFSDKTTASSMMKLTPIRRAQTSYQLMFLFLRVHDIIA